MWGREIDDHQTPGRTQQACRFADRGRRLVQIVKHLVHGDQVEAVALDGRRVNVALADLRMRHPCPVEIGAGDRQHFARQVYADATAIERREQFQQPARSGAEVEHGLERLPADGGIARPSPPPDRCACSLRN